MVRVRRALLNLCNTTISQTAMEAKADGSRACVLNVYQPEALIVSPATKAATVFQSQAASGTITIDALAGDIIVRSAQQTEGLILEVGNRYIYPLDTTEPIDVRQVVANSPVAQNFFDPTNWPPGAVAELDEYQANLGRPVQNELPVRELPPDSNTAEEESEDTNILENVIAPVAIGLAVAGIVDLLTGGSGENGSPGEEPDYPEDEEDPDYPENENAPQFEVNPTDINFERIPFGSSETETVILTNVGSAPLTISGINTETSSFTVDENSCIGVTIAPNGSCNIIIEFTPAPQESSSELNYSLAAQRESREFRDRLIIVSDAANSQNVSLRGIGYSYTVE